MQSAWAAFKEGSQVYDVLAVGRGGWQYRLNPFRAFGPERAVRGATTLLKDKGLPGRWELRVFAAGRLVTTTTVRVEGVA